MAEPDLELGEGVGEVVLLALPAFLPSVICFSKPKIKKYICFLFLRKIFSAQ